MSRTTSFNTAFSSGHCKLGMNSPDSEAFDCLEEVISENGRCWRLKPFGDGLVHELGSTNTLMMAIDTGPSILTQQLQIFIHEPGRVTANKNEKERVIMEMNQGEQYKLEVSAPSIIHTTEDFRGMSQVKRECVYSHERELDYLTGDPYSYSSCMLECSWRWVKEVCGCVPVYLSHIFPQDDFCDVLSGRCFRNLLKERHPSPASTSATDPHLSEKTACEEQCPKNCDSTEYDMTIIEYEDKCKMNCYRPDTRFIVDRSCRENVYKYPFFCDHFDQVTYNYSSEQKEAMLWLPYSSAEKVNMSRLEVQFDKHTVLRIEKTAAVSTIDIISNIGGTLGLFSGFSILSGIEILYWIMKAAMPRDKKKR